MPHIHVEPGQHDFTASALIFRSESNEPKILLHMHKRLHRLMQPGGHIELNENPWQAIAHEIDEETGYTLKDLDVLQPDWALEMLSGATAHPLPFCVNTHNFGDLDHKHTDMVFVFLAKNLPSKAPDIAGGESGDLRWLNKREVADLDKAEIGAGTKEIAIGAFDTCLQHWNPVPTERFGV